MMLPMTRCAFAPCLTHALALSREHRERMLPSTLQVKAAPADAGTLVTIRTLPGAASPRCDSPRAVLAPR